MGFEPEQFETPFWGQTTTGGPEGGESRDHGLLGGSQAANVPQTPMHRIPAAFRPPRLSWGLSVSDPWDGDQAP